jgi:hypothetical protein
MELHGATSRNDRYAWGFVNHKDKVVIFGAWDVHTKNGRSMIMSADWERNDKGHKQNAFGEAMEYINLVEEEDYQLKTFPMIIDTEYEDVRETGRAKIKDFIKEVTSMKLEKVGSDYFAVGAHKSEHSVKQTSQVAEDINDIFESGVDITEKQSLVMSRIGQGRFRKNVTDIWGNGEKCALTLVDVREMLIASHIVPWSKCDSNEQRLDGANGILLCAHIDKLFDSHKLTFVKQGHRYVTKLAQSLDHTNLRSLGIEAGFELCADKMGHKFKGRFDDYIKRHNEAFGAANF